jgi:hypothetical protein
MKQTLIVLLLLVAISSKGQMKIGDLTVSDSIGHRFLIWCYDHPDTIEMRTSYSYMCSNCTVSVYGKLV